MIPYKPFAQHLNDNNIIATPAELHAHASGMLVVNNSMEAFEWIKIVIDDYSFEGGDIEKLKPVLSALFEYAKEKISADNYSFTPLLPDDDSDLSFRLDAFATWCGAFLTGLAIGGLKSEKNMHDDVHEFIYDLEKLAKVDTESDETQGEEADFVELVEYVKAGALVLYSEFEVPPDDGNSQTH